MKHLTLSFLILSACSNCSCNSHKPAKVQQPVDPIIEHKPPTAHYSSIAGNDAMVMPGKSVGKTKLGSDAADLEANLGKPDVSDAAMGKAWLTWYSNKQSEDPVELNIYIAYADSIMTTKTVQQIRVTSSFFKTSEGIGSGNRLSRIKQYYPEIKAVAAYNDTVIYDATDKGIAFEISGNTCTGLIVHQHGKKVTDIYLSLHPGMKIY